MPTYEYACRECSEHIEVVQKFTDDALTECPACSGPLRKVFGSIGIAFKGSGFYKNDSRSSEGGGKAKDKDKDKDKEPAKVDSASSGSETKSDTKSDSKSDAKTGTKKSGGPGTGDSGKGSSTAAAS